MGNEITIRLAEGKWSVRAGGAVLVESANALELSEGNLPAVIYFPREDIAMPFLEPTESRTTCPHKGEANYFSIETKSETIPDAAWSYEDPKPEMARIKGYIAFYQSGKVAVEQL